MKYLKLKLTLLGVLVLASLLVIGNIALRSITYPILSVYILFLAYNSLQVKGPLFVSRLLALFAVCYLGFFAISACRSVLCGYGERRTEYINRKNPNIKIVGRDFSCLGTTGDLILYKNYSLLAKVELEIYYKTFPDYKDVKVDTTIWKRIDRY